jgi:hypothetical protein
VERGQHNCSAYIAESGAKFRNIDKGPMHGEKCMRNCVLKSCNRMCFLNLSSVFYDWFFENVTNVADLLVSNFYID